MEQSRDWSASTAAQALVPIPGCASTVAVHDGLFFVSSIEGTSASREESVEAELREALRSLRTALRAAGASLGDVVQLTFALRRAGDVPALDVVTREFFQAPYPARVVLGAPIDAPVSVSAIAVGAGRSQRRPLPERNVKETLI
jgi:enamine deaminase RidA (YjgF/YER057c/UK114 family)